MNQEILQKLQAVFPEAITEKQVLDEKTGKVSFEYALKEAFIDLLKDNFNLADDNQAYGLNFPGKKLAKLVAGEPSYKTLKLKHGDGVNEDTTENVYIEGDNLEVLKVLKNAYHGQIKMIYIDPPYNTGSDGFVYNDDFSETQFEYWKKLGYINEDGAKLVKENSENLKGYKHSGWLTFMYPRLKLARDLLRDDGVIFISIDDNEVHNLRLICDEIFGADSYIASVIWQKKTGAGAKTKGFINLHEYVLCYSKSNSQDIDIEMPYSEKTKAMYNKKDEYFDQLGCYATWPLDTTSMDERPNLKFPIKYNGIEIWPKKQWLWSKDKVEKAQSENKLVFNYNKNTDAYSVRFKGYLKDENGKSRNGKPLSVSIGPYTQEGTKDFEKIFEARDIFPFPKPVSFVEQMLNIYINNDESSDGIFLDFFSGSATTAHAVMKLNSEDGGKRKYICVQIPDITKPDSEAAKAGYPNICEIGKERIRRAGKQILTEWENKNTGHTALDAVSTDLLDEGIDSVSMHGMTRTIPDIGFKVFTLADSPLYQDNGNIDDPEFTQDMLGNLNLDYKFADILYHYVLRVGVTLDKKVVTHQLDNFNYTITERKLLLLDNNLTCATADKIVSLHLKDIDKLYYTINSLDAFTCYTEIEGIAKRHNLPCEVL